MESTQRFSAVASSIVLLACNAQAQAELTPPSAPAETMKPLTQVESRIDVASNGNRIIRNSAGGNDTNYVIAAGNDGGTIQTSTPAIGGPGAFFEF